MPKYEYACKSCGEHLEVTQSFTDEPLTECPACGGRLRKVFGVPVITFKGSGFYRTDNRSDRSSRKAEASDDGKADAAKADAAKTDGKADAAKTESSPTAEAKPKAAEAKTA